ncbi:hypothetical protein BOX15_Mlig006154g1 [Macrostomum lignano]|uniref:Glucosidase II subunit alpha n=1 Tax=Macrostomum lignano TaxID=282301 RepID=A0A267EXN0_9PLAT|nr:hypothetical protein BOX15_Mlig006154g1 [Macrostomum lignano]
MRWFVFFGFLLVWVSLCVCVDRSNFKTCEQSGFCKRHRKFATAQDAAEADGANQYQVDPASIATDDNGLSAALVDAATGKRLSLRLARVATVTGRTFRLKINEFADEAKRPRFEPAPGDSLVADVAEAPVAIDNKQLDGNLYVLEAKDGAKSDAAKAKAVLQLKPFRVDCLLNDRPLISVNSKSRLMWEFHQQKPDDSADNSDGLYDEEFKGHRDAKPHGSSSVGMDVAFPGFEHVYGIPEHADSLALRSTAGGEPYRLYNLDVFEYELNNPMALYGSVPLVYAHSANNTAGAFWHNPSETWVDVQSSKSSGGGLSALLTSFVKSASPSEALTETHWMSESGVIDLFLLLSDTPLGAFRQYASLTGTTPLPPIFSIAYHQCRWNYNDETDVLEVDRNFDENDIPYDVIWLDIEHTDGKRYFTWDSNKFPNPQGMLDKLNAKGRQLVTVVDPHIKRDDNWALYQRVRDGDIAVKSHKDDGLYDGWCWPGSSVWPDFIDPAVRKWWANEFKDYVAAYTWNDMGEPSVFNGPEVTMHKDAKHHNGWEHREVHNLYGALVHQASWDGQLVKSPQRRPFVLTRAFFAGSQRTAAVWTGDNAANWDHLKASVPMVLSLSITGITFSGADVGGFFGNTDPELLVRWYQAGSLQPFFRAHAHLDTRRREPWLLDAQYKEAIRSAILLRYTLLPYLYTQFYLSARDGRPVMAPLWVYYPKDEATFSMDDQHLLGPDLLFKPVTEAGATSLSVYLPKDSIWYRHDTWEGFGGGQTVSLSVSLTTMSLFYRAGGIVARRDRPRRSSAAMRRDPITLVVLLGGRDRRASGHLYLDDGYSLEHKTSSAYLHCRFNYADGSLTNTLVHSSPAYADADRIKVERLIFVGVRTRPKSVVLPDGGVGEFTYTEQSRLLVIRRPNLPVAKAWTVRLMDASASGHDEL